MRDYTRLDLLRFEKFAKEPENKGIKGIMLISAYNKKYPELSSQQKLINLTRALALSKLHKKITGEDLPKCTTPDCDCLEQAEEANGGQGVKQYPCLAIEPY